MPSSTTSNPPPPGFTPNPAALLGLAMSPAVHPPVSGTAASLPVHPAFPVPKLRLEIRDLSHPATKLFLGAVNAADCMPTAIRNLLRLLYLYPSCPTTSVPPTRSVTLVLRDMDGVAYTTGSELDSDHKEIHFSLRYIAQIARDRLAHEITGVLTHELVHCFQHNALGSCPGGLIEGIADWVRLCCDLAPPHWKHETEGNWDRGYQHTAYFLQYLEQRFGAGTVVRLNEKLRLQKYEEKAFWTELLGHPVHKLWDAYVEKQKGGEPAGTQITTCKTDGS